jgi:hypothetical protein
MRPMRPIRQPGRLLTEIAAHPAVNRRPMNPNAGSDLRDIRTRQHRTNGIQALLNHRQDNQSQSRPSRSADAPRRRRAQGAETDRCHRSPGERVSHISRRRTLNSKFV